MATVKSFTDIPQSKKLAEILPLESADMHYSKDFDGSWFVGLAKYTSVKVPKYMGNIKEHLLPCWSLAALLSVLPNKIVSHETAFEEEDAEGISDTYYKHIELTEEDYYMCCYVGNGYKYKCVADSPIDACYKMALKLNELNLL